LISGRPCALAQIIDRPAEAEEVLLVGLADHGHDQAVLERHGDAEIDVFLVDDVVAVDRRVHDRELAQRVDNRFRDERGEGEPRARRFVLRPVLVPQRGDPAEVHLVDRVDVRRGVRAEHHVLGNLPAHDAHRDHLHVLARSVRRGRLRPEAGGRRPGSPARGARLDEAEDVLLGDPSADAGPLDQPDVDVVLLGDPPDQRR
jgi:hypothetical protein